MKTALEIRHLRTLRALSSAGSVVRAAQLLSLTQSALSHQLKLLEDIYGVALFERKSVPLIFSAAGMRLLELAERIVPQIEQTEREVMRMAQHGVGQFRIAVECHTCFDWLMPAMDHFRLRWPDIELDIVSGFHTDPIGLIHQNRADIAVVSESDPEAGIDSHFLFEFDIVGLVANDHPYTAKPFLVAEDFSDQTLITYPVPDEMLDIMRQVLIPAGVYPLRRTAELTVALLQLVASRRGIATLPLWAVQSYLDRGYVTPKQIGQNGLRGSLYIACASHVSESPYFVDFVEGTRECCFMNLPKINLKSENKYK